MKKSEIQVGKIYKSTTGPNIGLKREVVYEGTWIGFKDPLRVQYRYLNGRFWGKLGSCSKAKFAQWAASEAEK
jgi:hypothetical protein